MNNVLEDVRDKLFAELECVANEEQITKASLDVIDKLTHSIKSIETTLAMYGYEDNNSYRYGGGSMRYNDGYSYSRGGSRYYGNMRGSRNNGNGGNGSRGYSNKGYNMGRYSREDSKEKMIEKLQDYMDETDSERVKESISRVIAQIESED